MRIDEWIAAFGSEDLPGDEQQDTGEQQLEDVLSSWCNGTIRWVPGATKDINYSDDYDALLDYSSSSSESSLSISSSANDKTTTTNECSPQACNLQCVCVDCLKCSNHCTCNYSHHDYQCRATASPSSAKTQDTSPNSDDEVPQSGTSVPSNYDFWSSSHFPFSSQSTITTKGSKKKHGKFKVVPNNICVEASFMDNTSSSFQTNPEEEREDLEQRLQSTFGTFHDDNVQSLNSEPREIS